MSLLLIWIYCIVAVELTNKEVYNIALYSLFCSISTFEFNSIIMFYKITLVYNLFYISHLFERLELYQYASVSDLSLATIFLNSFILSDSWEKYRNLLLGHINIWSFTLFKIQILLIKDKFCFVSKAKDLAYTKKHA